jgi:hypothetical protein
MSAQEERFRRLLHLRDLQHRAAVVDLRVAHAALDTANDSLAAGRAACSMARYAMSDVLQGLDQHAWLMNRADAWIASNAVTASTKKHQQASFDVQNAALRESEARCAARQMQLTFDHAKHERGSHDARLEQAILDEAGRRMKGATSEYMAKLRKP